MNIETRSSRSVVKGVRVGARLAFRAVLVTCVIAVRLVVLLGLVGAAGSNTSAQTYLFNKAEFSAGVNPVSGDGRFQQ